MTFGVSPQSNPQSNPKSNFLIRKVTQKWLFQVEKLLLGLLCGLLWGRPQKSLFSHFRATLNFSGFRGFWEVGIFLTPEVSWTSPEASPFPWKAWHPLLTCKNFLWWISRKIVWTRGDERTRKNALQPALVRRFNFPGSGPKPAKKCEKSRAKGRGVSEGGFCKMYASLDCGAPSAKCTAWSNIVAYALFPWAWRLTLQKPPLLKPPFSWFLTFTGVSRATNSLEKVSKKSFPDLFETFPDSRDFLGQEPKGFRQKGYPWTRPFLKISLRNYCIKCPQIGEIWPFIDTPFCGYPFGPAWRFRDFSLRRFSDFWRVRPGGPGRLL